MRPRRWLALSGVAIVAAVWWFVLRIGPRRDHEHPVAVPAEDALAHARRLAAAPRVRHEDLVGTWGRTTARDVEVLPEGRVFYPRMLADIETARESIHIMQYGFTPGPVAEPFAKLLAEKARSGVAVRLVLDAIGSWAYLKSRAMLAGLVAAGAEIVLHDFVPPDRTGPLGSRRFTRRIDQSGRVEHRKLVLVDGAVAYVGGAGIESHFADGRFHDVYVRFTGPVTAQLQAVFAASFLYHGGSLGPDDAALQSDGAAPADADGHPVTLLMNWPRGWRPLTEAAEELIASATRQLDVVNPYIGDPRMIAAIVDAARRGAAVRMVVSDEAHASAVAYMAFKHHYDELLAAGIEIWEYPSLVHAKVIVADDRALVGTLNLDTWAMYRNPEMGLLFDDADVAEQFRKVLIEPDIAMSVPGRPAVGAARRATNRLLARASYVL